MKLPFHTLFLLSAIVLSIGTFSVYSQSNDQNFPTPITSSEINGQIKARDIGDGRLTRYFYAFDGGQGDIFINVVTKNFSGDIDVFTADSLKPLTKMVIFPDSSAAETGRLIYLRKGERLILRIEGRSPNDDPAMFRIKLGGSFIALASEKGVGAPTIKDDGENESGIRVNSVGTIIEVIPKPKPPIAAIEKKSSPTEPSAKAIEKPASTKTVEPEPEPEPERKKPVVVVTEAPEVKTIFGEKNTAAEKPRETVKKSEPKPKTTTAKTTKTPAKSTKSTKPADQPAEKAPDPLASIRLIVQLKTGEMIERPMNEVLKFSVDKGVLTVIQKDGKISKYSIFDVAKVTIE